MELKGKKGQKVQIWQQREVLVDRLGRADVDVEVGPTRWKLKIGGRLIGEQDSIWGFLAMLTAINQTLDMAGIDKHRTV